MIHQEVINWKQSVVRRGVCAIEPVLPVIRPIKQILEKAVVRHQGGIIPYVPLSMGCKRVVEMDIRLIALEWITMVFVRRRIVVIVL